MHPYHICHLSAQIWGTSKKHMTKILAYIQSTLKTNIVWRRPQVCFLLEIKYRLFRQDWVEPVVTKLSCEQTSMPINHTTRVFHQLGLFDSSFASEPNGLF